MKDELTDAILEAAHIIAASIDNLTRVIEERFASRYDTPDIPDEVRDLLYGQGTVE